jgi:predicted RNase H-like HicB family nuclease
MQLLLIIIEKSDNGYSAYSPSLTGLMVTAATREEIEQETVAAVEKRLADLQKRHHRAQERLKISLRSVEETVLCSFGERGCGTSAKKEGLCPQHWRMLYGHALLNGSPPKQVCLLCSETNQWVLENWHYPCRIKAENPDWPIVLHKKRQKARELKKAKKRELASKSSMQTVTRSAPSSPPQPQPGVPCSGVKTQGASKGQPCGKESQKDGLCHAHWKKLYGHDFSNFLAHRNGCRACEERNTNKLFRWDSICPKKGS